MPSPRLEDTAVKFLKKIELAFCFPGQFDKKVHVIRLTQMVKNRNTRDKNMQAFYKRTEFWSEYTSFGHIELI